MIKKYNKPIKVLGGLLITRERVPNCIEGLFLRRSEFVPSPFLWSIPIGHAEPFEISTISLHDRRSCLEATALREFSEEVGLPSSFAGTIADAYYEEVAPSRLTGIFVSRLSFGDSLVLTNNIQLDFENDDFMWCDIDMMTDLGIFHSAFKNSCHTLLDIVYHSWS